MAKKSFSRPQSSDSKSRSSSRNSKPNGFEGGSKRPSLGNRKSNFKSNDSSNEDRPKRAYGSKPPFKKFDNEGGGERKPRFDRNESSDRPKRAYGSKPPFKKFDNEGGERKPRFDRNESSDRPKRAYGSKPPFKKFDNEGGGERKPRFDRNESSDRPKRAYGSKPPFKKFDNEGGGERKPRFDRNESSDRPKRTYGSKPPFKKFDNEGGDERKSGFGRKYRGEDDLKGSFGFDEKPEKKFDSGNFGKPYKKTYSSKKSFTNKTEQSPDFKPSKPKETNEEKDGSIRLNRYIANSGICSRREADVLITDGMIKVNGKVVSELGYKVMPGDSVKYGSKLLSREKLVYVLLNKPKDFLTTTNDPDERKTVMTLVANAAKERIYPVGRLDRQTTGLLLFTNDGELTEKLTHPSHNVKKIYQVELDRPLDPEDGEAILNGLYFEEGKAVVDSMAVLDKGRKTIGIEIHIGWNRIVRRIFEAKGYSIEKLDRVTYAGLTKKDLTRGTWRHLTEKEVVMLKHF
jgi:23S rRNA pseudouridine2605 synthase